MNKFAKAAVSVSAIVLAALHQFLPGFHVDPMTLTLLAIALLVWILKYIDRLEITGVGAIDFRDTKAATDKIDIRAEPEAGKLNLETYAPTVDVSEPDKSFVELAKSEGRDPSLILIAFRMEVETRVRTLVRVHNLLNERVGLDRMIRALVARDVVDARTGSGLLEIIALGNQAAHGAKVGDDAANWVLDVGSGVLLQLDQAIAAAPSEG